MGNNVFGNRFNSKKNKFKQLNLKNTELIFEDEDTLIFKINDAADLVLFGKEEIAEKWDNTKFSASQLYVVIDFQQSYLPHVITVHPNGTISGLQELSNFPFKFKLKPKSKDEIEKLDTNLLIYAINANKLDINSLSQEIKQEVLSNEPNLFKKLNSLLLDDNEFTDLVEVDSTIKKMLTRNELLRYRKINMSPEQKRDYEEQDLYVFLARDKFVELPNGTYKKDIDIENFMKIDQYSKEGQTNMAMLKIRAVYQADVKMYMLWAQKGVFDEILNDPWEINADKNEYLRDAIRNRMQKFGPK